MNDIVAIMRAADFAARKHADQKRKGEKAEPYVNHLIEVAILVAEATDGQPDAVIAALLHDVVEDQDVTNAEITARFGPTVASVVAEVTDDKNLLKQVRKEKQIACASQKSDVASVIKLADKTSNLLGIANSPPPWPTDRKRAYVEWARAVVVGLPLKPQRCLPDLRRRRDRRQRPSSGRVDDKRKRTRLCRALLGWRLANPRDNEKRSFRLNAYRVLLTRSRVGTVIFVPIRRGRQQS